MATVVPQYAALFRDDAVAPAAGAAAPAPAPPAAVNDASTPVMQRSPVAEISAAPAAAKPAAAHAPVLQKSAPPVAALSAPASNLTRFWPVLILIAGIGLIGFALLSRGNKRAPLQLPVAATIAAATPAPTAPTLATVPPARQRQSPQRFPPSPQSLP